MAVLLDCFVVEVTRFWGGFQSDVLAGAFSLSRHFHLQRLDFAFMWGLFVYQRYRGTAASRLLMEAAIDCCEHEQGIESVVTCFDGGNLHARQYFSRFGFELYDPGPVTSNEDWRTSGLVHIRLPDRKSVGLEQSVSARLVHG